MENNQCRRCGRLFLIAQIPTELRDLFINNILCFKCQMEDSEDIKAAEEAYP
jgi:hypothetical protein